MCSIINIKKYSIMKKIIFVFVCLLFVFGININSSHAKEGDIWLTPSNVSNMTPSKTFDVELHLDTGGKNLGAFNVFLDFDPTYISVDTSNGDNGISVGNDTQSYIVLSNPNDVQNGHYRFAGISASNFANGNNTNLVIVHLKSTQAFKSGETNLKLRVSELADDLGSTLSVGSIKGTKISTGVTSGTNELVPIFRLYNRRTGAQLYTRGEADRDKILNRWNDFEFTDNAPAFYASLTQQSGLTPIFRLYNRRTGAQLYTRGEADRDKILKKWKDFEFTDKAPAFWMQVE